MQAPERIRQHGSPLETVRSLTTSATASSAKPQGDQAVSSTPEPQPSDVMDRLNVRMTEIFGSRWTSQYPRAALDTWAKGLADMTRDQLARGVNACVAGALEWPPTLPEFRKLCLTIPGMQGLPEPEEAWLEAYAIAARRKEPHTCSHPAVWHAYVECGDLPHMSEEAGHKRFIRIYAVACRMFADGKPLTAIPQMLPAPKDAGGEGASYTAEQIQKARDAAFAKLDELMGRSSQPSRARAFASEVSHGSP